MPRPRSTEMRVEKKVSLPATLAGRVEVLLFDPVLQKPRYGGWSELVTELLDKWVAEQHIDPHATSQEPTNVTGTRGNQSGRQAAGGPSPTPSGDRRSGRE